VTSKKIQVSKKELNVCFRLLNQQSDHERNNVLDNLTKHDFHYWSIFYGRTKGKQVFIWKPDAAETPRMNDVKL